jgi:hypothetical protein
VEISRGRNAASKLNLGQLKKIVKNGRALLEPKSAIVSLSDLAVYG